MAESLFKFEVVTPAGVVFSGDVSYFRAPGTEGQFGVLTGHAPFITSLKVGLIEFQAPEGSKIMTTSGGFIEVLPHKTTILAETAEMKGKIDRERASAAADRAHSRLKNPTPDIDIERAQLALARALNRLNALNR